MTALRDLYLEGNLLEHLPTSLTRLTTLVSLRLSGNRLRRLPDVREKGGGVGCMRRWRCW